MPRFEVATPPKDEADTVIIWLVECENGVKLHAQWKHDSRTRRALAYINAEGIRLRPYVEGLGIAIDEGHRMKVIT